MTFYELQQRAGSMWNHVGYFKTREDAEKHEDEFNTKITVNPLRIVERKFIDV